MEHTQIPQNGSELPIELSIVTAEIAPFVEAGFMRPGCNVFLYELPNDFDTPTLYAVEFGFVPFFDFIYAYGMPKIIGVGIVIAGEEALWVKVAANCNLSVADKLDVPNSYGISGGELNRILDEIQRK